MADAMIRVGIGGWVFEPWRGTFYPDGLAQKRELEYAASKLATIEINGTYYGSQKPDSFRKWYAETPEGFVFSLKGPRFATNRRVLAEAGPSIEKFFESGVTELKEKLGPINWQFAGTKTFDPDDFAAFLDLLPESHNGVVLRHAVEVRNDSFKSKDFIDLVTERGVAVVTAADSDYTQIGDVTAPFVYARIMGTDEKEKLGYSKKALDAWAARANDWAKGKVPKDIGAVGAKKAQVPVKDVFLYVISGAKVRNPLAAMAIADRLKG